MGNEADDGMTEPARGPAVHGVLSGGTNGPQVDWREFLARRQVPVADQVDDSGAPLATHRVTEFPTYEEEPAE